MRRGDAIVPSSFGPEARLGRDPIHDGNLFSDYVLRYGEVQDIIWPDDDRSRTGRLVEYEVLAQYRSIETRRATTRLYHNVLLANPLAGLADLMVQTLRADNSAARGGTLIGRGSKVLMLCINGDHQRAVILTGMPDPDDDSQKGLKDLGHYLRLVRNGLEVVVNDDGELIVTRRGPTDLGGQLRDGQDRSQQGARFALEKNGSVDLRTPDDKQHVRLDHESGKVDQKADRGWDVQVGSGKATIKSRGLEVGDATDSMLLGSRYRQAERQMHDGFVQDLDQAVNLISQAAQSLITAAGNLLPTSAGPDVAKAGTTLLSAAFKLKAAAERVRTFEAGADRYLSRKNKLD